MVMAQSTSFIWSTQTHMYISRFVCQKQTMTCLQSVHYIDVAACLCRALALPMCADMHVHVVHARVFCRYNAQSGWQILQLAPRTILAEILPH